MSRKPRKSHPSAALRGRLATAVLNSRRRTLHKMQRGICHFCGMKVQFEQATVDHLLPQSRGGTDAVDNLAMTCSPCNNAKGNLTEAEFRLARRASSQALSHEAEPATPSQGGRRAPSGPADASCHSREAPSRGGARG